MDWELSRMSCRKRWLYSAIHQYLAQHVQLLLLTKMLIARHCNLHVLIKTSIFSDDFTITAHVVPNKDGCLSVFINWAFVKPWILISIVNHYSPILTNLISHFDGTIHNLLYVSSSYLHNPSSMSVHRVGFWCKVPDTKHIEFVWDIWVVISQFSMWWLPR